MDRHGLVNKRLVIWGTGVEAQAAASYIREVHPAATFTFVDERVAAELPQTCSRDRLVVDVDQISFELGRSNVLIKSPGVSLYHPLIASARQRGLVVTSLLNLWIAENDASRIVMITGTKGKSTTASLLAHVLHQLGKRTTVIGNFGVPVTACKTDAFDYVIVEVSSYQAANFEGACDIGILTSLFPEHLDWHKTLDQYYTDKCRILACSKHIVVTAQALMTMQEHQIAHSIDVSCNRDDQFHFLDEALYYADEYLGKLENPFLLRAHNLVNVCAVMAAIDKINLPLRDALQSMKFYQGLPHRQQELGSINGVLFVDDSISTTPQSTVAALQVYAERAVTLIAGGLDRGVDYAPLVEYIHRKGTVSVVCMGQSGARIEGLLAKLEVPNVVHVSTMREAVQKAREFTLPGGAILLSPAAPSYDMYENYIAKSASFVQESGFGNLSI